MWTNLSEIAAALQTNEGLTALYLWGNTQSPPHFRVFSLSLRKNTTLRKLDGARENVGGVLARNFVLKRMMVEMDTARFKRASLALTMGLCGVAKFA